MSMLSDIEEESKREELKNKGREDFFYKKGIQSNDKDYVAGYGEAEENWRWKPSWE